MRRCWPAVLLIGAMATDPLSAQTRTKEPDVPRKESKGEVVRRVLDSVTSLEFAEQALPNVLVSLSERHRLNFVLDRAAITQMGFDPTEAQVSIRLRDVKLRSGLRSLLAQYNLSFAILDDTLLVTTEEQAWNKQLRQRVNIDIENMPLTKVLKELSLETNTNLVIDPRSLKSAQTPITLQLDDVPLESAVRLLAEVAGLKPVRMENVLFVTSEERAEKLKNDADFQSASPWLPTRQDPPIGGPPLQIGPAINPPGAPIPLPRMPGGGQPGAVPIPGILIDPPKGRD